MFLENPSPLHVIEGENATFECITGESSPAPVVYFERNGERFDEPEQYTATYGGVDLRGLVTQYSMKLVLTPVAAQGGIFNCVARNPLLNIEVHSLKVMLNVTSKSYTGSLPTYSLTRRQQL